MYERIECVRVFVVCGLVWCVFCILYALRSKFCMSCIFECISLGFGRQILIVMNVFSLYASVE